MYSPVQVSCIQYMTKRRQIKRKARAPRRVKTRTKQPKSGSLNIAQLANKVGNMVISKMAPAPPTNSFLGNLGQFAGNGISKFLGMGAYSMESNSLWRTGSQVPYMHSTGESIRFTKREYLGDISSSIAFVTQTFNINPGLDTTFPFLSRIASNFQEYRFKGLVFFYKSTSSDSLNSVSPAMGTVSMVAQYRADAPAILSKLHLLNEMWSAEGRPCDEFPLPVECSPKENPMSIQYVRTGALPANSDIKTFDLAKVVIATQGSQRLGDTIGELWCMYDVELMKPILATGNANTNDGAALYSFTGGASATPFGTVSTGFMDTIGVIITGTSIQFPANTTGTYVINWNSTCNAGAITEPVAGAGAFVVVTSYSVCPNNATTSDKASFDVVVSCRPDTIDDVPIFNVSGATLGAALTGTIRIYQVNSSVV